jgi:hypothetical protein
MLPINFVSVFVAAVVAFVLGFLFHGPVAGKMWMRLADIHPTGNEKLSDMIPQMFWNLVVNIVTAYVLAGVSALAFSSPLMGGASAFSGALIGVWMWAGFLVTTTSIDVIWMGRKYQLWLFESACSLIVMATMGAIIAAW